jgi:DNA-binding PadR family transcriptional regulator
MEDIRTLIDQSQSEMRRGLIVLSTLALLQKPHYGYSLIQTLEEKGMPIEGNTLYPLLRRLEKKGMLKSEWELDASKPRKYYQITDLGKNVLEALIDTWKDSIISIKHIIGGYEDE